MRYIFVRLALTVLFISVLVLIVLFARGYRFSFTEKKILSTGILVAASSPTGARVYINGALRGATNSNISLSPGIYTVEIRKEGYSTWTNKLVIKGEVVVKADALLFPQNPSLSPITSLGVVKSQYFPDSNKIVILTENPNRPVESPDAPDGPQDGIYILENARNPLSIFNPLKLIAAKSQFPLTFSLKDTTSLISPDGKQLLFDINRNGKPIATYLLSTEEKTTNVFDVSRSKEAIVSAWETKANERTEKILETFKTPFPTFAAAGFDIIGFSPDESKILYRAKINDTIPIIIKPRLIGTDQTPEVRDIEKGKIYVYDYKEDKNYPLEIINNLIPTTRPTNLKTGRQNVNNLPSSFQLPTSLLWYPDSLHLIVQEVNQISIIDFDGTHKQTVYSGPFDETFLGVSSEGKLLILANLNPQKNSLPDIYAVGIR